MAMKQESDALPQCLLEIVAPRSAQFELGAVMQDQDVFTLEVRLHLAHAIEIHDRATVDAKKPLWV